MEQKERKVVVLDVDVVNQIINYATQRPYKEVAVMLSELQASINRNVVQPEKGSDEKAEEKQEVSKAWSR